MRNFKRGLLSVAIISTTILTASNGFDYSKCYINEDNKISIKKVVNHNKNIRRKIK